MFRIDHTNINVMDLDTSIAFYKQAFDMELLRIKEAENGSFKIAFLKAPNSDYKLELTWLRDKTEPYDLGSNESHICFAAEDYDAAHRRHRQMQCICYENEAMGLYFVVDPDGYWMEVVPANRK